MARRAVAVKQALISTLRETPIPLDDAPPVTRLASEVASNLAARYDDEQYAYVIHRLSSSDKPFFLQALMELERKQCITLHSDSCTRWPDPAAHYTLTSSNRTNLMSLSD